MSMIVRYTQQMMILYMFEMALLTLRCDPTPMTNGKIPSYNIYWRYR